MVGFPIGKTTTAGEAPIGAAVHQRYAFRHLHDGLKEPQRRCRRGKTPWKNAGMQVNIQPTWKANRGTLRK